MFQDLKSSVDVDIFAILGYFFFKTFGKILFNFLVTLQASLVLTSKLH
jgi:hypothetical protein